eukprot:3941067-Rhodomonas_salina.1
MQATALGDAAGKPRRVSAGRIAGENKHRVRILAVSRSILGYRKAEGCGQVCVGARKGLDHAGLGCVRVSKQVGEGGSLGDRAGRQTGRRDWQ